MNGVFRPRSDHRVVLLAAIAVVRQYLVPLGGQLGGVPSLDRNPAVDVRTRPVRMDQADRNTQLLGQTDGEMEPAGGTLGLSPVLADDPSTGDQGALRFRADSVFGVIEPDERVIAVEFLLGTGQPRLAPGVERHLHIRLTAANPNLADDHVLERQGVVPRDDQGPRLGGGRHCREPNQPAAVLTRGGFDRGALVRDRDLFPGVGPSPNVDLPIALKHRVVGEGVGDPDIGVKCRGEDKKQAGESRYFRTFHR